MYENKNKTVKNIHYKNTEPQHQLKGDEQYKNNRVSKLEKIKNTELRKNYLVLRTKKKKSVFKYLKCINFCGHKMLRH